MRISAVIPNYNNAASVVRCAQSLLDQQIPPGTRFSVTVVDDGSTDDSAAVLEHELGSRITLVCFPENRGRCSARNAGAAAHEADVLLFVDSDCVAADAQLLAGHAAAISDGSDVVFGNVLTPHADFWSELQRQVAMERRAAFTRGEHWVYTTANVSMKKSVFDEVSGFDPAFDRHGFEDRDLFIRLAERGARAAFCGEAAVMHEDHLSLAAVAGKFERLGRHAAQAFASRHPDAYGAMGYSKLDTRLRPGLGVVDTLAWPVARRIVAASDAWLQWSWLPFRLRVLAARTLYGISFLHGTRGG